MYPKREPYKTIFRISTFFGLWNEVSKWHRRISLIFLSICSIGYTAIVTLSILQAKELSDVLETLKVVPLLLTVNFSMIKFILEKTTVRDLLEHIEEIEEESPESKIYFDEAFKDVKRLFLLEAFFIGLLATPFILIPPILKTLIFPLFIPDIIVDYETTFIVCWAFESFCGLYCGILYLLIYEFQLSIFMVLNGYMKFFRNKLKNLQALKDNFKEAKDELVNCVQIHHQIKKFLGMYTEIFSLPVTGLLFFASISVCSNTFIILTLEPDLELRFAVFPIVYEIFIFGMIFIPCFHANTIMYQSENFLYDLFSSNWIESNLEYRKLMIIFSENLKKKIVFEVFKFINVDLQLFMELIQFVYSMYCVLNSMENQA